jgi:drug/metabolite transporter (DMT)-like permease
MGSVAELTPPHPKRSEAFAASMLVVACACWGTFFSLAKNWQEAAKETCPGGPLVGSLTLLGIRPILAFAVFAIVRPRLFLQPTRREWLLGAGLGLLNFSGNVFQVWGLSTASPAVSGFFTSMASLWVPVIALVFLRTPIARATWLGLALGLAGLAALGIDSSQGFNLGQGEVLTALSSLVFAAVILCLDRVGRQVRSEQLALGLIAVGGLPGLPLAAGICANQSIFYLWVDWLRVTLSDLNMLRDVVLLTLFSTVIGTFLLAAFQPRVPASRAALIYLTEPVFAAVISVLMGHDEVTQRLLIGGFLILGGNALAAVPAWLIYRSREQVVTYPLPNHPRRD